MTNQGIRRIFAWIAVAANGDEDIIVALVNGTTIPLVVTTMAEAKTLREQALTYRDERSAVVKLVEWTNRHVIEESKP